MKKNSALLLFSDYNTLFKMQNEMTSRGFFYRYFFTWDKVCAQANAMSIRHMPLIRTEYILVLAKDKAKINYYTDAERYEGIMSYKFVFRFENNELIYFPIQEAIEAVKAGKDIPSAYFTTKPNYNGRGFATKVTVKRVIDNITDYVIEEDCIRRRCERLKKSVQSILTIPNVDSVKQRLHPTQKPIELMKKLVSLYSKEGDTVLDFCMGSGSTGVACKELNRDFIGIEKDEHFFNIAKERLND